MTLDSKGFSAFIKKKYHLPIISGSLFAISCIYVPLLITNFIFLVPLLFFMRNLKSGKEALKGAIWFGVLLYAGGFYWTYILLKTSVLAVFLYLFMIIYFTLTIIVPITIAHFIYNRWKIKFFLFMPFLWTAIEHLKTFGPFRFTGDHVANSMAIFPQFIQFIDITGYYGITFWVILINALIFESIISFRNKSDWIKYAVAVALITFLPISYSLYKWNTLSYKEDLKISMLQPNIPLEKKLGKGHETEIMNVMISLTSEAIKEKSDLIIWPETSYPFRLFHWINRESKAPMPRVSKLARDSETPILVGAYYYRMKTQKDFNLYNAALLVDSNGNVQDYYGKMYLVPFTEALPTRVISWVNKFLKIKYLALIKAFSPGEKFTIFNIDKKTKMMDEQENGEDQEWKTDKVANQKKFGVLVCYEGLFPELSKRLRKNGADFLVCITNDAWFGRTRIAQWHASALRLRAMENRVSIARCANTGVSCFFDPTGRIYQSTKIFTEAIVKGCIATSSSLTFYTRYGDIIVYISYPLILILILSAIFLRKKDQQHLLKQKGPDL